MALPLCKLKKLLVPILCLSFVLQVCARSQVVTVSDAEINGNNNGFVAQNISRESKNLFPFVWVTFEPSPCGTDNAGVCVQRGKCAKKGGTAGATCQDGFGECCTFVEQCNTTRTQIDVTQIVTTLQSPAPATTQCSFRFRKEPNICQIKLNFVAYTSTRANPLGECDMDRLRITNTITVRDFTTCGTLTGQHMYLTFGSQDTIDVTPQLKVDGSMYRIVATKIPCNSPNRAPDYCLQYFTKPTDLVRSFGYPEQQQNNQQYTICVRPLASSEEVTWRPCPGETGSAFDIISPPVDPLPLPPAIYQCTSDWIQLKGQNKMCLPFIMAPSRWKPYDIVVNFDRQEFPDPPLSFQGNFDPADCAGSCPTNDVPGVINCACSTTGDSCTCVVAPPPAAGGAPPLLPDIDNRGFCLEYTQ